MAMVLIDDVTLKRIADSIKAKRRSDEKMLPSEMPGAIDEIPTGGEAVDANTLLASIADGSYEFGNYVGTEATIATPAYAKQFTLTSYSNNELKSIVVDRAFDSANNMTSFFAPNLQTLTGKTSVFNGCFRLVSANIGNVTELPPLTFYGCNNLAYIPNSERLTYIGQQCFPYNAAITIADLPKLERLDSFSFSGCSNLKEVYLGSIVILNGNIFNNCHKLEIVKIGDKCTKIDRSFMQGSKADVTIIVQAKNPPTLNGSFIISGAIISILVPAELVDLYKSAPNWSNHATIISAISS